MKIIAIYNNKGGVGKTATTVNLAYLASRSGKKTLIGDLDPQGSTTFYYRIKPKFKDGPEGLLKGAEVIDRHIRGTDFENLDLLPADLSFRHLDTTLLGMKKSRKRLLRSLKTLANQYDYIFLDCPPNLSMVSENIFWASDLVVVPIIPTTLSFQSLIQWLKIYHKNDFPADKLLLFFSMVEIRKSMHRQIIEQISENIPAARVRSVLKSRIPYTVTIENMGITRMPVAVSDPRSLAAIAYRNLWAEIREYL